MPHTADFIRRLQIPLIWYYSMLLLLLMPAYSIVEEVSSKYFSNSGFNLYTVSLPYPSRFASLAGTTSAKGLSASVNSGLTAISPQAKSIPRLPKSDAILADVPNSLAIFA